MKTFLLIWALFGAVLLSSCSTTGNNSIADRASNFAASPGGRVLINTLITAAVTAGSEYATGRDVDPHALVAATLDGAADSLRSLAGTPAAGSPKLVAMATMTGAGVRAFENTVAPVVAATVDKQIQDGTHPDQAIENVATTMNAAAAATRRRAAAAGP